MKLNELSPAEGSVKQKKRVGRGVGSGSGKTSGKGSKGYNARSGGGVRPGWEGGQMPIHRRLPKRGFKNIFKKSFSIVNLKDLINVDNNTVIDPIFLFKAGLIKGKHDGIKILADGDLNTPLNFKGCYVSKSARSKIETAGGKIED